MAVDTEYLDELMKSIEPTIYPDGVPGEENENDQEDELASIPEKKTASDSEQEVASAIEAIDAQNQSEMVQEPGVEVISEDELTADQLSDADANAQGEVGWDEINVDNSAVGEEIELDMNMSEEEIEAMLNAAKSSAEESVSQISDSDDVTDILSMFDGDSDISDIKDTLEKSDNNVAVDASMLEQPEVVIPDIDAEEEAAKEEGKEGKKKKAKGKKKGKAKEEASEEGSEKGSGKKKGGFFSKLFNALTEEVPDETDIPEKSETGVTDENAQILSELDAEDKGKKKKKKKAKKSKGSKEQPETQGDERDIREKSDDEEGAEGGKGKGKKDKKPKKEKKQKLKKVEEPDKPSKKLPRKRVRNTFILCLSILAAILVLTVFGTEFLAKKQARFAFDNANYEEAYTGFYGEKLSDSDNEIYQKSRTIMFLQRKMSSYENYMQLGMKPEALNALLEGYELYPAVMAKAEEYGVTEQVKESYDQLVVALGTFGLSTLDAEEINAYTSKVMYNKRILSIVNGTPFEYDGIDTSDTVDVQNDTLLDILPEEEDFLPENPEDIFED